MNNSTSTTKPQSFINSLLIFLVTSLAFLFVYSFLFMIPVNFILNQFDLAKISYETSFNLCAILVLAIYLPLYFIANAIGAASSFINASFIKSIYKTQLSIEKQRRINIEEIMAEYIEKNYVQRDVSILDEEDETINN